jgi:ABC-type dipeptide/oligopeptide/nickel transport system permease component/ABC-type transport system substrate-binding protein
MTRSASAQRLRLHAAALAHVAACACAFANAAPAPTPAPAQPASCAAHAANGSSQVIIGMQLEPPTLDPTSNPAAAISEALYGNLYEGLVQFAPDGAVLPSLAERWDISDDGKTYVLHLVRTARFHDGSRFDAAAAKFSLDRARAPDSLNPQRSRLSAIRSVEAQDEFTLRLVLGRRSGGLLQTLALGSLVMVSPQSAAGNGTRPIGTGPFKFMTWRRGDSLTLMRNEEFRAAPPTLDQVTFRFISDPTAAYAALMAGDVDAFANYPAPESFAQFAADPRFAVFEGSTEMEVVLGLNERVVPLNDVRVRRAISHALDRSAIIDGAMFGHGTPIGSHFPPRNPAYVDLTGEYPHDVDQARALLREAGYPHGLALRLKLPPPSYARRSGEIVASQLAQIGIRVRIENLEWAQWLTQVYSQHDFDMTIVGHAEPLDYDIYGRDDYYFGYSNPEFKSLLASLDDSDAAQRRDILERIQRKLADDAVNGFLFQYPRLAVWDVRLRGVGFDTVLGAIELRHAQWVRGAAAAESGAAAGRGVDAGPLRDSHEAGLAQAARALRWSMVAAVLALLVVTTRRLGSAYLLRRLGVLALTLLAATAIVFVLVQVVPGDPVRYMLGLQADAVNVSVLRHQLGLDAAPLTRYALWVAGLLRGDFGLSYTYRIPVGALVAERLSVSLPLALYALLLSTALAVPAGLASAALRGRPGDALLGAITQVGLALPNFWAGMLLVLWFAVGLHWVSAGGFPGWSSGFWAAIEALTLPAIALAMPQAAILARVLRGALLESLREDYVRTARAKGAGEWRVLWRHALPNALVPVLTVLGMQFSFLLAGGVIIENVFFLPGLGRLVFQAIVQRDLIVVQSVVVMLVFAVVCVSFLTDLTHALVNPRLRAAR